MHPQEFIDGSVSGFHGVPLLVTKPERPLIHLKQLVARTDKVRGDPCHGCAMVCDGFSKIEPIIQTHLNWEHDRVFAFGEFVERPN